MSQHEFECTDCRRVLKRACCWFSFLSFVSILALSWMYVCFIAFNDHNDVNWLAFKTLKKWVSWYMIVMVVSAVLATYCLLLLVFGLLHLAIREPLNLHWLHKVFLILGLLSVTLGTAGFCIKWEEEWKTVYLSFQLVLIVVPVTLSILNGNVLFYTNSMDIPQHDVIVHCVYHKTVTQATAPFLQLGAVVALTLISWLVFQSYHRAKTAACKVFIMMTFLVVSAAVFLCPLAICSPCITSNLPPKPALVGHRGAPMTDPFQSVSSLSKQEKMEASNQKVPSLSELLVMAKKHNVSLIFDLKNEKNSTGFQKSDSYYTTETIKKSGISQDKIWWLSPEYRHDVRNIAPGFKQVYHNEQDMNADGGGFLNMKYSSLNAREISELRKKNVSVNLWVVNERWLFSLLWCSGASSVTTNACHILKNMYKPDWHLEPNIYMVIWISADVISLLLMFGMYLWQRRRKNHVFRQNKSERRLPLLPR
ncbi:hypothetical protein cypCar_00007949 [Cyprinus carpio]|nr:hypothetical protein cypCar_00007949 [Cyprinus carpio]